MKLNPGMKAEYKKRHDEIWPELVALLKQAGVSDYSIHLDEETNILFGVLWRRDDHGMDDLPNHPVMQRWWAHMADIMETKPDNEPVAVPLKPCSIWNDVQLRHVAVIDIGKTNAKVALVDLDDTERGRAAHDAQRGVRPKRPTRITMSSALWAFILDSLASLNREQRIDAISVTTHGATARCSTPRANWRCRCSTTSIDGPDEAGG